MPVVYLSPSTQETNYYPGGGNEEYYMNLIVDEMIPYLNSSGIQYIRNNPYRPVSSAINQSNSGTYDLHFSLHTGDTSGPDAGKLRGAKIFYIPGIPDSHRAATIIEKNLKDVYPIPDNVTQAPTNFLVELKDASAPAVMAEIARHDNADDAMWVRENVEDIAENLALSLAEFFSIPLITPQKAQVLSTPEEANLYARPSIDSNIVTKVPPGTNILVLGEWENWYIADYLGKIGYIEKFSDNIVK